MQKFKHSKYKNTGIIFELLSKQVAMDVLTSSKNVSLDIVKKFFKEGTSLHQELACYQILMETRNKKDEPALKLVNRVLEQRANIEAKKLNREKYNLIGEIKKNYVVETFFDSRMPEYKLYASIYKLFEYTKQGSTIPGFSHISCYNTILEHMTSPINSPGTIKTHKTLFNEQEDDVKKLALKLIIEKFNTKYKGLNDKQKTLVSKFINGNTSLAPFRNYIYTEVAAIQEALVSLTGKITDPSLKIKLKEVAKLTTEVTSARRIEDAHISSMIKYYELIDYLKERI
tara:strand:- start:3585 stop:4442 length:858 start_codon:yes stop_codon:yes gene_type:complete